MLNLRRAFKAVEVASRLGKLRTVEVQVIGGESPGRDVRRVGVGDQGGSPFRQTMVAEVANAGDLFEGNYGVVSDGTRKVASTNWLMRHSDSCGRSSRRRKGPRPI